MSRTRAGALVLVAGLSAAAVPVLAAPAQAQERSTTRGSMTLTVSQGDQLRVEGQRVRVRGSGYDRSKGIYVAFCVDNGPGQQPTPCGGGADTEGRSGNSVWISDLPPAYGTGLAQAYGPGGTFDVEISVRAQLNDDVDCRQVQCAVVTRADHTRSNDRSLDVVVPVSFAAPPAQSSGSPAPDRAAPAAPPAGTQPNARPPAAGRPAPAQPGSTITDPAAPEGAAAAPEQAPEEPAEELPLQEPVEGAGAAPADDADDTFTAAPDTAPAGANGPSGWLAALGAALVLGLAVPAVRMLLLRRRARGA